MIRSKQKRGKRKITVKTPVQVPRIVGQVPTPHVPLEEQRIADMTFGMNEKTPEAQKAEQAWVRETLLSMDCKVAGDITTLGCTGVAAKLRAAMAPHLEGVRASTTVIGTRLRLGLAGSGFGLPCFVPPSRFCLVHNTIGGLELRQTPHHAEYAEAISRPLTDAEAAKTAALTHARKLKSADEVEAFMAGSMEDVLEAEDGGEELLPAAARVSPTTVSVPMVAQAWKCTEHKETNWACRHCLAQALVEGALTPLLAVGPLAADSGELGAVDAQQLLNEIAIANDHGQNQLYIYACVATYTRKLSRD